MPTSAAAPRPRDWSLLVALGVYWGCTALLLWQSIQLTDGHLIYSLDDAYIHMAMAHNFAIHGVWGVTGHEFTSTSSSPLWTALLAVFYRLFGFETAIPLILNVVFGSLTLGAAHRMVRNCVGRSWNCGILLAIVFGSALPTISLIGMEHTMHAFLTLTFVSLAARAVTTDEHPTAQDYTVLALVAAALSASRYEGLFATTVAAVLLVSRARYSGAMLLGTAAAAVPLAYGLWAAAHGGTCCRTHCSSRATSRTETAGVSQSCSRGGGFGTNLPRTRTSWCS